MTTGTLLIVEVDVQVKPDNVAHLALRVRKHVDPIEHNAPANASARMS